MNIFAKGKKQIILRREDLVKNTRLPSKELSKLFFGNTHFFEHYRLLCVLCGKKPNQLDASTANKHNRAFTFN